MKVCLVSKECEGGGIGNYILTLAQGLRDIDCEVSILAYGEKFERRDENGFEIINLPNQKVKGFHLFPPFSELWRWKQRFGVNPDEVFLIQRSLSVDRWIRDHGLDFDVIEVPEWGGEGYHLARHFPLVLKLHTPRILVDEFNRSLSGNSGSGLAYRLERAVMERAEKIYSPSQNLKEWVQKNINLRGKKIEVIPNPVDTEHFCPRETGERKQQGWKILYCGRLEKRKGVDVMVRAIPQILSWDQQVTFTLVGADTRTGGGEKSFKSELMKIGEEFKINPFCKYLDFVPHRQMPELYNQHDICVVPSRYDNFPYTCLEAMSCGKPVVAARAGGIPEIVDDGVNGLLFSPENEKELAEKVLSLIQSSERCAQLGREARKKMEREFAPGVIARRTKAFYQDAV
jgi:glycosyltransferase involved in cell wall biosynthesis